MSDSVSPDDEEGFIISLLGTLSIIEFSDALGREAQLPPCRCLPA